MYKKELIECASIKADLPRNITEKALTAILETISESMEKEEPVVLIGFGKFFVSERKARKAINPMTKQVMEIPASKKIKFKASKKK
ncbi:MAG: HU family DNA-binding protein [Bacteroidales bacterium]